ncbi:DNA methyltransferase family protein [Flindersiella endophytica]
MAYVTSPGPLARDTPELRKARGAFFTPAALCRYVMNWALRDANDRVLDPSCGEAAFLLAAGERIAELSRLDSYSDVRVDGVELHDASARHAEQLLKEAGYEPRIEVADFFTLPPRPTYDAVIGNPPYIRYQDFAGEQRARGRAAALRGGVALTGLASSWAAFTVHASLFLRRGGRLGLVLPAELLTVNYAAEIRRFLMQSFRSIRLVLFTERVFPGVLEEVVLLLADGFEDGPTDHCELYQALNVNDLANAVGRRWKPIAPESKWTPSLLSADALRAIEDVDGSGGFTTLHSWGETTLGMVTGNNRYFTMSPVTALEHGIDKSEFLHLSPPGSRHLRQLAVTSRDWRELGEAGRRTLLFRPAGEPSTAALQYIKAGETIGVNNAYKCRVRKPWWRVPLVPPADLLLTYMNADAPRLCTNRARVHHLNSVHGVYLRSGMVRIGSDLLPLAALNSMSLLTAEIVGRSYGGGMLKIEPKEADRLSLPSKETLEATHSNLTAIRQRVTHALQAGGVGAAAELVDEVLLIRHLGLPQTRVAAIREAHAELQARRAARGSSPRSKP